MASQSLEHFLMNLLNRFNLSRLIFILIILIIGIVIGSTWKVPLKFALINFYQSEYSNLVYKCDYSMRDHFIAKAEVLKEITEDTLENLDQTELALIDCHEYDLLRKKLIAFGLTPNDLSYMGLKAIEENKVDLKKLVEIHEILY